MFENPDVENAKIRTCQYAEKRSHISTDDPAYSAMPMMPGFTKGVDE